MPTGFNLADARSFIARSDVPAAPVGLALDTPEIVFESAKTQALLVGAQVLSFDTGVEADFREAIADSALLAQLVADKAVSASADPIAWFDRYFAVLGQIGWAIQARDTASYKVDVDGTEVHEAILKVVVGFLGAAPAAVALVVQALESLKAMNPDSPTITLFHRESQKAKVGRFQFTLVRQDSDGGLTAEAMAFALTAEKTITQILFFKLSSTSSELRRSLGSVSLNRSALSGLRPALRAKVQAHMASNLAEIQL